MSSADQTPPPIRVLLPDDQELQGVLHERRCWPNGGWMYWVGLPMWVTDAATERVEPREYRVWLTDEQARPVDGVTYDRVPTYGPPKEEKASARWSWTVERVRPRHGRPGAVIVHITGCEAAPAGGDQLDVFDALDVLSTTAGAVACKECGASISVGPLLNPES
ncbi:DUF6233 domain-containing protein [Streptomyces sp. NRRL F-525]|uniref:DUF6233 domain-containing protein n=1 Tax=Streptomyces sp. NRRL F-525 TaxID=1463861 RepID=UPI000B2A7529|nr:DUF6233 domain-containing protein [Streptomyces sp. NRRL F-525]